MSYALDVRAPAEHDQSKAVTASADDAPVPWSESAATVPDSAPVEGAVFDEDKDLRWIASPQAMSQRFAFWL